MVNASRFLALVLYALVGNDQLLVVLELNGYQGWPFSTGVLDENGQDILVSSVLTEEEKLKQNIENRKKKPSYNPYEGADELEEPGVFKMPQILKKYDEEIDGERKKAFTIGALNLQDCSVLIWPAPSARVYSHSLFTTAEDSFLQ